MRGEVLDGDRVLKIDYRAPTISSSKDTILYKSLQTMKAGQAQEHPSRTQAIRARRIGESMIWPSLIFRSISHQVNFPYHNNLFYLTKSMVSKFSSLLQVLFLEKHTHVPYFGIFLFLTQLKTSSDNYVGKILKLFDNNFIFSGRGILLSQNNKL